MAQWRAIVASGKLKGNSFERLICKQLSEWWTCGRDDSCFWRTSNSGGRATIRAKKGKTSNHHCGDVCALDSRGEPFTRLMTTEIKRGYSKASIHDVLDKLSSAKTQTYEEWFSQAERERREAGAVYWLIIHQRNRRNAIIFFPTRFCLPFCKTNAVALFGPPALEYWYNNDTHLESVSAVPLATFFTKIHPSQIVLLSRDQSLRDDKDV